MVQFYLTSGVEQHNTKVSHKDFPYLCGGCGHKVRGRVIASEKVRGGTEIFWCLCTCGQATILTIFGVAIEKQWPTALLYHSNEKWPDDLKKLFSEAASSFSVQAFTSTTMICRKILMACACEKGAEDGKSFAFYVDYIVDEVLVYPDAKAAIDRIRNIGNGANHSVEFVSNANATIAMDTIVYLLNALYALPAVAPDSDVTE